MYRPTSSLTDPPAVSPLTEGVAWIQGAALGSTATIVAVIAVATIGMLMLSGRLELRRGIAVVIGSFILFGASGVAAALLGLNGSETQRRPSIADDFRSSPDLLQAPEPQVSAYDPYAGASVPEAR